jgi:hypothetical protein
MSRSSHPLPPHVAPWIDDALGRAPAPETHATCAACALCADGGDGRRSKGPLTFEPAVKCCTYRPALPNYLVGAALADDTADGASGRRTVAARVAAGGVEVSPLGLLPAADAVDLGAGAAACPHLDDGRCGIWQHRHAVCSTWFCKHERGARGHAAWLSLRALLIAVERSLALWCCIEEGIDAERLARLVARGGTVPGLRLDPAVSPAALWGSLAGAEQAFYVRCHERVRDLTWEDVLRITGPSVHALAAAARQAFAALDAPVPERLRPGTYTVLATGADGVLAQTYSVADPLGLPSLLLSVLHLFDGRPTPEVMTELADERGLSLDPDFLRTLVDFRFLVEAP